MGSMFRINAVGLSCAEIKVPPFTKNKKQLSRMEVDTARKYAILELTLPINMIMCDKTTKLSLTDKIVVVCSALCKLL